MIIVSMHITVTEVDQSLNIKLTLSYVQPVTRNTMIMFGAQ